MQHAPPIGPFSQVCGIIMVTCMYMYMYMYSGKFLYGIIFRIFHMRVRHMKIKTTKIMREP